MSTIEQKDKGTEAKGRAPAKKTAAQREDAAKAAAAKEQKAQAREANPARASLLDLYFGEAAPKPRGGGRPSDARPAPERQTADRRGSAEVNRPVAEVTRPAEAAPEARRRPAAAPPAAKARPRASEERKAAPEVVETPAEAAPEREAEGEVVDTVVEPVAAGEPAAEESPARSETPEPEAEVTEGQRSRPIGPAADGPRPRPMGPAADGPRPRAIGAAADGPRPRAAGPALEGPRPRGSGPTLEGPRPRGTGGMLEGPTRPGPGMSSGPTRPGMGIGPTRPGMGTGPTRPGMGGPERGGYGDRPSRPAGGGFGRGPRAGGGGPGGRGLAIPKVDPKVVEQQQQQANNQRRPLGQGGDRRKGDGFSKRENEASRPPEEKLFGRRPHRQAHSAVDRRTLKPITITGAMTVKELAHEMGVTAAEVIKKLLTGFGIMATINQELDSDTSVLVGAEFGIEVTVKEPEISDTYETVEDAEEPEELKKPRWPVVTIMGHVDHGKTSLLDAIREARVAAGEAGGITQHIGAYTVEINAKKITFLDTPGHEAFTAMRARGANVTDIAILVVAADDSVMPQTIESINHAKAAGVPILVAINKIDRENANPERVKQDLTAHGVVAEEWGGETIMVPVSAVTQKNLDLLLENVLILSEVLDLKANPDKDARGTILEAELDKGRGPVATVLVQAGTLLPGDAFVAGSAWGTVRAMFDERGRKLKKAGPSQPVQILGFNSVPSAGDIFRVARDAKLAREVAERRANVVRAEQQQSSAVSLEDLMARVAQGEVKDLNLVVKADVQGSVEAIRGQLEKLKNDEVQVKVIHSGVGAVTETDIMLATTAKAVVIGFNVRPDDRAATAAREQNIDIRSYNVIYNIVDDIKAAIEGMLKPRIEEVILGKAEVRQIFKVPKAGMAAGCMVIDGKITRNAKVRLVRDGVVVHDGEINSLRRFKDEVRDVATGYECGLSLERYQDFKTGDILEAYELKEVKAGAAS